MHFMQIIAITHDYLCHQKQSIFGVQKGVIFDPPWTPPWTPPGPPGGPGYPKKIAWGHLN